MLSLFPLPPRASSMSLLLAVGPVLLLVHQVLELLQFPRHLHPNEPRPPLGLGVDQPRLVRQRAVHLDDLAGHGGVHVARGLDGFHRAEGVPRVEAVVDRGQVDEDYVPQGRLGEVGDADGGDLPVDLAVFVGCACVPRDRFYFLVVRYFFGSFNVVAGRPAFAIGGGDDNRRDEQGRDRTTRARERSVCVGGGLGGRGG